MIEPDIALLARSAGPEAPVPRAAARGPEEAARWPLLSGVVLGRRREEDRAGAPLSRLRPREAGHVAISAPGGPR